MRRLSVASTEIAVLLVVARLARLSAFEPRVSGFECRKTDSLARSKTPEVMPLGFDVTPTLSFLIDKPTGEDGFGLEAFGGIHHIA